VSRTSQSGAAPAGIADVEEIRAHFPALARRHEGLPVAYFDGPGGTQVPRRVVDAMDEYLFAHNANTHWAYPTSAETDDAIEASRRLLADFVNGSPEEIAFGANMTTHTFHLARALGRRWGPGDEIVVTELDHHANVDPWRDLERERGVSVRKVAMNPGTGELDPRSLEESVTSRTRLVAIGRASNALGTVNDLSRAADLARATGALFFVDAVHSAPHLLPDVRSLGCDFLACSAYKFYGPHVGMLWGKRELLEALEVPRLEPAPGWAPELFETGTQNHEGIVGAGAAVEFLASLCPEAALSPRGRLERSFAGLHARGASLLERLWEGLSRIPGVRLFGPPPQPRRTPTLSFVVAGRSSEEVAIGVARRGVFVSHGDFYATTAVRRLGLGDDGVVRAGCACYTTAEEIDRLIQGVREEASGG
jgi:cysteine desulfurase family protein (TIGR01976 family)